MKKKKILFLGYKKKDTKLISYLRRKKILVIENGQKTLSSKKLKSFDLIISFGYKKIIKKDILKNLARLPVNLHISYLPYNKGSHPNYWSFKDRTPSGISIHEIDAGIDTGKIIFRKRINFKLKKNLTFNQTYWFLRQNIEKLFIRNFKSILEKKYKLTKIYNKGTFHKKKDLPKKLKSWNSKIFDYI